jgi:hypothetical protein
LYKSFLGPLPFNNIPIRDMPSEYVQGAADGQIDPALSSSIDLFKVGE